MEELTPELEATIEIPTPMVKVDRTFIDSVFANMFSNPKYIDYNFYAHIVAQCKLIIDNKMQAPAGVSFSINHYRLYINTELFGKYTLEQGLGVIKHEMLHILSNHVARKNDRNHEVFNIASDTAINQQIKKEHLPEGCLFPEVIGAPANKSAEQYYDFLKKDAMDKLKEECPSCGGSGDSHDDCEACDGEGKDENGDDCKECNGEGKKPCGACHGSGKKLNPLDDHGKWEESEGNSELQKDITKNMIEKAMGKSRGNLPNNIDSMLELFSRSSQVSWKKELRYLAGNKRANKTSTIMRPNRRQPNRIDLKGNKKDYTFSVITIADVSGSQSNSDLAVQLNELYSICKITNSDMTLIQCDCDVQGVEKFSKSTKVFNRKASGGTTMYPGVAYIMENRLPCDLIIITTDGYIEDVSKWPIPPKCRVMFLTSGCDIPGIENTRYKQFTLAQG